jgi:hypothetical protein
MARTIAELPAGSRITDHISLGVIARTFPVTKVRAVLTARKKRACGSGTCRHTWSSTM